MYKRQAFANPKIPRAVAEKEILGFRFSHLTHELSHEWHLGDALRNALVYCDGRSGSPDVRNIVLSHQIENAARRGWDSPVLDWIYKRTSDFIEAPVTEVKEIVTSTAKTAQETATEMGIDLSWRLKPANDLQKIKKEHKERVSAPMPQVQNQISAEIDKMIPTKPDVQLILRMIIEGIQRGGGMDRTLLAILTPERSKLMIKYHLGDETGDFISKFDFSLENKSLRLFPYILRQHQKPVWMSSQGTGTIQSMFTHEIREITGCGDFFLAPLILEGKDIGLIYSDRGTTNRTIDKDAFINFVKFTNQANNCLQRINESPLQSYLL